MPTRRPHAGSQTAPSPRQPHGHLEHHGQGQAPTPHGPGPRPPHPDPHLTPPRPSHGQADPHKHARGLTRSNACRAGPAPTQPTVTQQRHPPPPSVPSVCKRIPMCSWAASLGLPLTQATPNPRCPSRLGHRTQHGHGEDPPPHSWEPSRPPPNPPCQQHPQTDRHIHGHTHSHTERHIDTMQTHADILTQRDTRGHTWIHTLTPMDTETQEHASTREVGTIPQPRAGCCPSRGLEAAGIRMHV